MFYYMYIVQTITSKFFIVCNKKKRKKKAFNTFVDIIYLSGHDDSSLVLEQINLYERISPLLPGETSFIERQVSNLPLCRSSLKELINQFLRGWKLLNNNTFNI